MRAYKTDKIFLTICRSLKEEYMWGAMSVEIFLLVGTDINFMVII